LIGGAEWKPTGVTNEQSQFLETRKFTASEICSQMFQIDPAEMGLPVEGSSLTYANLEQRNARKVQVTFLPWITRLENALTALLPRPQYVKLNVNGLLRGDTKTRFDAYAVGINNHFMTPNEARDFEDWQPLEGGDVVIEEPSPGMTPEDRSQMMAAFTLQSIENVAARVPTVNVEPPDVHVEAPVIHVTAEPPVVNVAAPEAPIVNLPELRAEAPVINVNVEPTPVNVESPTVHVAPAEVNVTNDVQPAGVTVAPAPPRTRTVQRDPLGNIVKVTEE
jgi:hypothetical protein